MYSEELLSASFSRSTRSTSPRLFAALFGLGELLRELVVDLDEVHEVITKRLESLVVGEIGVDIAMGSVGERRASRHPDVRR